PVGEGDVVSPTLFGDAVPSLGLHESQFFQRISRYHRPAPPPLVLANGVAGLDREPRLRDAYRTYSWVVPLDRRLVRSWAVEPVGALLTNSALSARGLGVALLLVAASTLVLALTLVVRPLTHRGRTMSPLDVAAIGAVVVVAVALARGAADSGDLLAQNGT